MSVFELGGDDRRALLESARLNISSQQEPEYTEAEKTATGAAMGTMRALAESGRTALKLAGAAPVVYDAAKSAITGENTTSAQDAFFKTFVDNVGKDAIEYWTPQAEHTNKAGDIIGGVFGGLTQFAATGFNPFLFGAEAGLNTQGALTDQGVNLETSSKVGGVTTVASAAGAFLPPSVGGTFIKKLASGAAINLALGAAERGIDGAILQGEGYNKAAEQYSWKDSTSAAVDAFMGAAFGVMPSSMPAPKLKEVQDSVLTVASGKHAALDVAPGEPATPASAAIHHNALSAAIKQVIDGEPVNVGDKINKAEFSLRDELPSVKQLRGDLTDLLTEDGRNQFAQQLLDHQGPEGAYKTHEEARFVVDQFGAGIQKLHGAGVSMDRLSQLRTSFGKPAEAGAVFNQYAGQNAQGADLTALQRAKQSVDSGADAEQMRQETGWHRGPDNKWRFEIDDSKAVFDKKSAKNLSDYGGRKLSAIIQHDAIFNAYPFLKDIVVINAGHREGYRGSWNKDSNTIEMAVSKKPTAEDVRQYKSVLLHEIQHAIQDHEGFAKGGSPDEFQDKQEFGANVEKLSNQISMIMEENPDAAQAYRARNQVQMEARNTDGKYVWTDALIAKLEAAEKVLTSTEAGKQLYELDLERSYDKNTVTYSSAFDQYRKLHGEIEARDTQARADMSAEDRRANKPYISQGIPDDQVIIRHGNAGRMNSIDTKAALRAKLEEVDYFEQMGIYTKEKADKIRGEISSKPQGKAVENEQSTASGDHQDPGYIQGESDLLARLLRASEAVGTDPRTTASLVGAEWTKAASYSDLSLRGGSFVRDGRSPEVIKTESDRLVASAKKNGFFVDNATSADLFRKLSPNTLNAGIEHHAFRMQGDAGDVVLRVTAGGRYGPDETKSPAQYLHRIEEYNKAFPDLQMRVLGVGQRKDGKSFILTAQKFVDGKEFENMDQLHAAMVAHGWESLDRDHEGRLTASRYKNKKTGAIISDVHEGNVLHDNEGNLYPIDVHVEKLPKTIEKSGGSYNQKGGDAFARMREWRKEDRAGINWHRDTGATGDEMLGRDGVAYFQSKQDKYNPDLFVAHNLSAENLLHASELGGLAAPSLGVSRTTTGGFTGFGEITLLADKSILTDRDARTFDADVYSPRHPRAVHKIDNGAVSDLEKEVNASQGKLAGMEMRLDSDSLERRGLDELLNNDALKNSFLVSKGILIKPKMKDVPDAIKQAIKRLKKTAKYESDYASYNLREQDWFIALTEKHHAEDFKVFAEKAGIEPGSADAIKYGPYEADGSLKYYLPSQLANQVASYHKNGGQDSYANQTEIAKKFRDPKLEKEFVAYAEEKFAKISKEKRLVKYTKNGNAKYSAYNLDNIVAEMTRELQGGEGFNYGAGSVRSAFAFEFKHNTIESIKSYKDGIVSKEKMNAVRDEANDKLGEALEKLSKFYKYDSSSFGYANDASSAIAEGPKGQAEAFRMNAESKAIIKDITSYLRELPSEYFETKMQRAVGIGEFKAAIVPKGTDQKVLDILAKNGVTDIEFYKSGDSAARTKAISKKQNLLFQKGGDAFARNINGDTEAPQGQIHLGIDGEKLNAVISLFGTANKSTALHELSHNFLEIYKHLNQFDDTPTSIKEDYAEMRRLIGADDIGSPLKTEHHERFAQAFEQYTREGKAPTPALKRAFEHFKEWMTAIYQRAADLGAPINDDIRAMFDKMLGKEMPVEHFDPLLKNKDVQNELRRQAQNAGWAEVGGKVIMDENRVVTGRTSWMPKEEWYAAGMGSQADVERAVGKAIRGEKLSKKQQSIVAAMLDSPAHDAAREDMQLNAAMGKTTDGETPEQKAARMAEMDAFFDSIPEAAGVSDILKSADGLLVPQDDGSTVSARQLMESLHTELQESDAMPKVYDAAINCFLRG